MVDETNLESFKHFNTYWLKQLREKTCYEKNVKVALACNKMNLVNTNSNSTNYKTKFEEFNVFDWHEPVPSFLISASMVIFNRIPIDT